MAEQPIHSFSRKLTVSKKRTLGSLREGRSQRLTRKPQHTLFTFSTLPDLDIKLSKPPYQQPSDDTIDGVDGFSPEPFGAETAVHAAVCTIAQVKREEPFRREMEDYVSKVFALSPQDFKEQDRKEAEMLQKSDLKLSCALINFEPDTAPATNSPLEWFCVLGVLSEEHRSSKTVKMDNLEDWKAQNLVEEVFMSSVQPHNESIDLPVHNINDEWLVVEVWNKGNTLNGLQKLRKLLNKKECYFVGRTFCKLQTVSPQSETKRFEMYSHSAKHKHGYLECCVSIKRTDVVSVPLVERLREHRALLTAVVLHECKRMSADKELEGDRGREWDAQLDPAAKRLLRLHSEFCSLNTFQQVALQFLVLFNYRKYCKPLIQPPALELLLETISTQSPTTAPSEGAENDLRSELFKNLQDFLSLILKLVNNHLVTLDIKNASDVMILKNNLVQVQKLYDNKPFVSSLLQSHPQSLSIVIETAIKKSTTQWCSPLLKSYMTLVDEGESLQVEAVDALRGFSRHCLNQCQRVEEYLVSFFHYDFHVNYFDHFFVSLDDELSKVSRMIKAVKVDAQQASRDQTLISMYEVYITFHKIKTYCMQVDTSTFEALELRNAHLWFEDFVPKWIKLAMARCKDRVKHAVEEDKVANVIIIDGISFSSSLVDTVTFLGQMVEFWKNLNWPNPEQSYGFLRFLVTCIIDVALYYVDLIYQKSLSIGMATATTELCIVLNSMQEMRNRLEEKEATSLMEDLHLERFFLWLDSSGGEGLGGQARLYVKSLLDNAAEDIGHKIVVLTEQLGTNFNSSIKRQLEEMVKEMGSGSETETKVQAAINTLEQYLDNNLSTLNENLSFDVFRLLLIQVWTATVRGISSLALGRTMNYHVYERLYITLLSLQTFFRAEGEGLTGSDLETEEYIAVYKHLKVYRLPTEKLILMYCEGLASDHPSGDESHGELTISVAYVDKGVELVLLDEVNIQPPMARRRSTNIGPSTLWAQLFVLPDDYDPTHSAKACSSAQKKGKSQTMHKVDAPPSRAHTLQKLSEPVYLPVKRYVDGTILVLRLHQRSGNGHGKDEFVGNCAISMKNIGDTKKNFSLHLFHTKESALLYEIRSRCQNFQDKTAARFVKSLALYSMLPDK